MDALGTNKARLFFATKNLTDNDYITNIPNIINIGIIINTHDQYTSDKKHVYVEKIHLFSYNESRGEDNQIYQYAMQRKF